jgi:hypothetical protein
MNGRSKVTVSGIMGFAILTLAGCGNPRLSKNATNLVVSSALPNSFQTYRDVLNSCLERPLAEIVGDKFYRGYFFQTLFWANIDL